MNANGCITLSSLRQILSLHTRHPRAVCKTWVLHKVGLQATSPHVQVDGLYKWMALPHGGAVRGAYVIGEAAPLAVE